MRMKARRSFEVFEEVLVVGGLEVVLVNSLESSVTTFELGKVVETLDLGPVVVEWGAMVDDKGWSMVDRMLFELVFW